MAEKRSVYLSSQALSMPRRMDSLSGRINQALERYAWIVESRSKAFEIVLTDAQDLSLCIDAKHWARLDPCELIERIRALMDVPMSDIDCLMVAELTEARL